MSELTNNKTNVHSDAERGKGGDLPPIENPLLYAYGAILKLALYAFFGIGSVFLGVIVLPLERIFIHPKARFQKAARATVSFMFRFFISIMRVFGVVRFQTADREKFRSLKSKIVVANHPSMLDVVFLISLIPNADCIVRGSLANSLYAGVIRQLYIVNTLGYEEMIDFCKKSLATGTNLIVFPEGTRTPRNGTNAFKKGAARTALDTHCDIIPVYIGGSDKYGLGKHDAFFSYARSGVYRYGIYVLDEIKIADYESLEPQIAAKRITEKIHQTIADKAMLTDNRAV